jgi:hypothetical protein
VHPYLRYGLVVSDELHFPRRFFVHNEALDFFFASLLKTEVETSRRLENITFGGL